MKTKTMCIALTSIMLSAMNVQSIAQDAVNQALSSAEIVRYETNNKKLKGEIKTLKGDYEKALKEIAATNAAADKKPELNEKIVEQVHYWSALQTRMERLDSAKVLNFPIQRVDYDSIKAKAQTVMCNYYYHKGRTACEKAKKLEEKRNSI